MLYQRLVSVILKDKNCITLLKYTIQAIKVQYLYHMTPLFKHEGVVSGRATVDNFMEKEKKGMT